MCFFTFIWRSHCSFQAQELNKLFVLWARSFAFPALHFAQGHSSLASISQFIDISRLRHSFFHRIHNSSFFSFPLPSLFQAKIDKILRSLDGFVAAAFKNVNFLYFAACLKLKSILVWAWIKFQVHKYSLFSHHMLTNILLCINLYAFSRSSITKAYLKCSSLSNQNSIFFKIDCFFVFSIMLMRFIAHAGCIKTKCVRLQVNSKCNPKRMMCFAQQMRISLCEIKKMQILLCK